MKKEPQFLTMREAAELLRCTERHLQRCKADGRLPALSLGAHVRFRRDDVLALLTPRFHRAAAANA